MYDHALIVLHTIKTLYFDIPEFPILAMKARTFCYHLKSEELNMIFPIVIVPLY